MKYVLIKYQIFNYNDKYFFGHIPYKGYSQLEEINDNKVFSLVVKHYYIKILVVLVAQLDLELVQLDVKTTLVHSDGEEKIYMA